jgi:hypothetical protein
VGRSLIRLSCTAASLSRNFRHWPGTRRSGHYQTIPAISQTQGRVPVACENNPQNCRQSRGRYSLIGGGDCPSRRAPLLAIMYIYYGCTFGRRCTA